MVYIYCKFTGRGLGYSEQHEEVLGMLESLIKKIEGDGFIPETGHTLEGKPFFKNSAVKYSLSHADGCVVCTLSTDKEVRLPSRINGCIRIAEIAVNAIEVGCDVEPYENRLGETSKRKVAKRYFSENENKTIDNSDDFNKAFTKMWTAKESVVKCTGEGLAGLSKTDVTSLDEKYQIINHDVKKRRKQCSVSVCIEK